MFDVFNQKQVAVLRSKMWWVADSYKPFLAKFASDGEYALLELTDLRSLWVARIHNKTLQEDKEKYAKTLDVTQKKGLMNLFESLLTATDSDPLTPSDMHFTFKKRIKFFDFNWTFKLKKVNCNPVQLICKELLTPLSSALQAQTSRLQKLRKRFEHVEKEYIRKMTQMQKNLYKSPLLQQRQEWQLIIPKYQQKLLSMPTPDDFSKFCFQNFGQVQKKAKQEQTIFTTTNKRTNQLKDSFQVDHFEFANDYFSEELERSRQKEKKQKNIDFI